MSGKKKNKEQDYIPTTKVERAGKFISTGVKVGSNYVKHYVAKPFNKNLKKEDLDKENASDIYNSLSSLKGSALKIAQILSMDKNMLPAAYTDMFAQAQYSAPPLSYPLVQRTFKKEFKTSPEKMFESFSTSAINAASMGQVHKATKEGKSLAVKVQYPGVADSIQSDLKLAKPFALKLMNVKSRDIDHYMKEVEEKLLEETDYELELKQSVQLTNHCANLPDVYFPKYYPEYSSKKVLTMDWIEGAPLKEWVEGNPSQEDRNKVGQTLWNFYHHQMHSIRMFHADPHPGNFLVNDKAELGIIDFGCIKKIPKSFYNSYFELTDVHTLEDSVRTAELFSELEMIKAKDGKKEKKLVMKVFVELIRLLTRPISAPTFDFAAPAFFEEIFEMGERLSKDPELKQLQARGSRHFIYFNRTFFGLYNMLHEIKANIVTTPENAQWMKIA